MPKQTIKQALDELKDHIDQGGEASEKIQGLAEKVEHQLEVNDLSDWDEDVVAELEQQVIEFEDQHPMIAGALKSIMNALQSIGV